jgi:hypothetical protein
MSITHSYFRTLTVVRLRSKKEKIICFFNQKFKILRGTSTSSVSDDGHISADGTFLEVGKADEDKKEEEKGFNADDVENLVKNIQEAALKEAQKGRIASNIQSECPDCK